MTQKEILQYNKRCAKFLGAEINNTLKRIFVDNIKDKELLFHNYSVSLDCYYWNGTKNIHYIPFDMLQFHSDWNWIKEIVEAIVENKSLDECSEDEWYATIGVTTLTITSKKEAVVEAVNQFLIWHEKY